MFAGPTLTTDQTFNHSTCFHRVLSVTTETTIDDSSQRQPGSICRSVNTFSISYWFLASEMFRKVTHVPLINHLGKLKEGGLIGPGFHSGMDDSIIIFDYLFPECDGRNRGSVFAPGASNQKFSTSFNNLCPVLWPLRARRDIAAVDRMDGIIIRCTASMMVKQSRPLSGTKNARKAFYGRHRRLSSPSVSSVSLGACPHRDVYFTFRRNILFIDADKATCFIYAPGVLS